MLSRKNRIEESVFVSGKLELWMPTKHDVKRLAGD